MQGKEKKSILGFYLFRFLLSYDLAMEPFVGLELTLRSLHWL